MYQKKDKTKYAILIDEDGDCVWSGCMYDSIEAAVRECKGNIDEGAILTVCKLVPVATIMLPDEPIVTMLKN